MSHKQRIVATLVLWLIRYLDQGLLSNTSELVDLRDRIWEKEA